MAHGDTEEGATIAAAVLPAIRGLDADRARFYYDLVYNSLNEATRRALEARMKGYEYQSDFAKKYVAEGRAEGRAEEAARALLTVLRVRGIAVPDTFRERILAQKDLELLEGWLEWAADGQGPLLPWVAALDPYLPDGSPHDSAPGFSARPLPGCEPGGSGRPRPARRRPAVPGCPGRCRRRRNARTECGCPRGWRRVGRREEPAWGPPKARRRWRRWSRRMPVCAGLCTGRPTAPHLPTGRKIM